MRISYAVAAAIEYWLAIMRFGCEEDLWNDIKEKPFNLVNFCPQRINAQRLSCLCVRITIDHRNSDARPRVAHLMPPIRAISRQTALDSIRFRLCAHGLQSNYNWFSYGRRIKRRPFRHRWRHATLFPDWPAEITRTGSVFFIKYQTQPAFFSPGRITICSITYLWRYCVADIYMWIIISSINPRAEMYAHTNASNVTKYSANIFSQIVKLAAQFHVINRTLNMKHDFI